MARKSLSVALAEARAPYARKIAALESEKAELLKMLRGSLDAMCQLMDETADMPETPGGNACFAAILAARAAIARAEGRPT